MLRKATPIGGVFSDHALGRHFSWPNIASKMIGVERTPSFDNDLFDFICHYRRSSADAARCDAPRSNSNRKMAMVPTGNWGHPRLIRPPARPLGPIARKALRHLRHLTLRGPQARIDLADRDVHLTSEPGWRGRVWRLCRMRADRRFRSSTGHCAGGRRGSGWTNRGGASLLVELLSVQLFLKATLMCGILVSGTEAAAQPRISNWAGGHEIDRSSWAGWLGRVKRSRAQDIFGHRRSPSSTSTPARSAMVRGRMSSSITARS